MVFHFPLIFFARATLRNWFIGDRHTAQRTAAVISIDKLSSVQVEVLAAHIMSIKLYFVALQRQRQPLQSNEHILHSASKL